MLLNLRWKKGATLRIRCALLFSYGIDGSPLVKPQLFLSASAEDRAIGCKKKKERCWSLIVLKMARREFFFFYFAKCMAIDTIALNEDTSASRLSFNM